MLINELARRVELSIDTIRFYEKQGLLDASHYQRAANGYRHYGEAAVQRLTLIRMGQAAGFTLSEMHGTIQAWESDALTPPEKEAYMCRKIEEINGKIEDLIRVKDYLRQKIEAMRGEVVSS
jgi:MerR family transcriptional regulator, copper efflux regulator